MIVDTLKSSVGIIGTTTSALLASGEHAAAIFAGISTGVFMLISAAVKLRKPQKTDD